VRHGRLPSKVMPQTGGRTMSLAAFAPQREHFDRAWTWLRGAEPKAIAASGAVSVRDAPQPVQSKRRAAPKRTC